MYTKITHEEYFTEKELLMITLFCFMKSTRDIEEKILDSAELITLMPGLGNEMAQFAKGIVLMLCDKFVEDETLNVKITNLVGGNMDNVERYAERYAQEKIDRNNEKIIIKLNEKGFTIDEIIETVNVSKDFVEKTLAN